MCKEYDKGLIIYRRNLLSFDRFLLYLHIMEKEFIAYPEINGVSITVEGSPSTYRAHWHNDAEFTIILKNGCKYRIKDEIIEPEEGDIMMVWPRELHEVIYAPGASNNFVQFAASIIENNVDLVSTSRFFKKLHLISAKKEPELSSQIRDKIYRIRKIFEDKPLFAETKSKLLIYEMMVLIGEYIVREQKEQFGETRFSDRSWSYIRSAFTYISEHSADNISQTDVAASIGISPYYFSKLFNEYTEMSFPEYLSSVRVQNAISLLTNENLSITECAFMSGFQSTTTFNKVFHQVTGCTPREYRKMHLR